MVYLRSRSSNSTCERYFSTSSTLPTIRECQKAGDTPYCSPPNGTRICLGVFKLIPFAWSPSFYNPDAFMYIDFGDQHSQGPNQPGGIRVTEGSIDLRGFESYMERIPGGSWNDEKSLSITIREWYPYMDSYQEAVHQGPTLIVVTPESTATATPSATPKPNPPEFSTGKIIGITFGVLLGVIFLLMLFFSCCKSCRMGCCGCQGKCEEERVRRQQARCAQQERAAVQPEVDAIKASVAQGAIWTGPVRPGGMWATDMPRRASRRASRDFDEIRAATVAEEQRAEEQRSEEQRIERRRQEIGRVEEGQPPAYEEALPKYTP